LRAPPALANIVIPTTDPIPLPAPVWLLEFLLILTFVLHLLAMNVLLGGTFIALITRIKAGEDAFRRRLVSGFFRSLPAFFAASITLGIAPFLFVQTLYGQFIFTSSILMGWPWISVVLIIMLAYYGMYILAFRRKQNGLIVPLLSAVFLLLALIAFLYVNNFTLMLHPEKWQGTYHASAKGTHLHLSERMLIPRFLHFAVGAVALMLKADKQSDPRLQAGLGAGCALLTVVLMALMRDALRNAYLAPYLKSIEFAVAPQWGVFALFASLLVVGAVLWAYMMKLYFWRKTENDATAEASTEQPSMPESQA